MAPVSVLFVCNMNSVRSPMAAAILAAERGGGVHVDSAGIFEGGPDPFIEAVLAETGVLLGGYEPKSVANVDFAAFDVVIALTPEAAAAIEGRAPRDRIEVWPTDNPSEVRGGREAVLNAYREVRDELCARIRARFRANDERP